MEFKLYGEWYKVEGEKALGSCLGCAFHGDLQRCEIAPKCNGVVYIRKSTHRAPRVEADVKQTNPKDIVGVRKAPMSTVSAAVMAEVGVAMLEGAAKYGRHNYRMVGVRNSVYYDATMRHLMSWWEGEDIDPDSGMSHITKAIASLMVLRDAQMNDKATDDRAPRIKAFYPELNERAGAILDKYAERSPRHYTIQDTPCASS